MGDTIRAGQEQEEEMKLEWNNFLQINCRTCALSTAVDDGTWTCERWKSVIPTQHQYDGCACHVLHPDLVPWQLVPGEADNEAAYRIDGKLVRNGEGDAFVFSSRELLADPSGCAERCE